MAKFLDQFAQYAHHKVNLLYPEERTIYGDKLVGWLSDAVANDECPRMPENWEDALDLANEYLDITIAASSKK
jgi:hypothetical protein